VAYERLKGVLDERIRVLEEKVSREPAMRDKLVETLGTLNTNIEKIIVALFAIDGSTGIRGEVKEMREYLTVE
jgi:hypothetical protein